MNPKSDWRYWATIKGKSVHITVYDLTFQCAKAWTLENRMFGNEPWDISKHGTASGLGIFPT